MLETAWLESLRPWRRDDMDKDLEALGLSAKLWGDRANLIRQLLAPSPEVPAGLDHRGLCTLLGIALLGVRSGGVPFQRNGERTRIVVGGRSYSVHEARYEIVLRAIKAKAY